MRVIYITPIMLFYFTRMQEFQLKEKLDPILAFSQLTQGLQAIHSELDFHVDIKPQNIFYKNNIYTFTDFGSFRHFSSFSHFDE